MKKILPFMVLLITSGCIGRVYTEDKSQFKLKACNPRIGIKTRGFDHFTMDNGDILFVSKFSEYKCIHYKNGEN